ncbi:AIPR family protein [Aquimarina sp. 2201CG5-10]|uniref:AIPR family protein n=1 Tax=Aquimarina callyspongiae TaxID=3098150 RepID=UPI002AB3903E|nr:AIPR family protein [Aquimarina sp. 2201CG5-10]MDY8137508.1 AIPR family protein [Aquimarina sp. 2201CG5-10]
MDAITKSFLNEFTDSKGYDSLTQSEQFEMFTNFCIVNKEYDSVSFDEKEISTGKNTQGIDGIGIIVNNKLCNSSNEIQELIDLNRTLIVSFVLIQSKTSSKFDGKQIDNFFRWTKSFFKDSPDLFVTDEMKNFIDMKEFIYSNSKYMKERNPICNLYFCSTGKWVEDSNLLEVINGNKEELDNLNLFEDINFTPCDSKKLQYLYRKTKEPVEASIKFERKVTIPTISNIKVAYSGMIPFSEFRKIIIDDTGKMKSVFNDNIRDYLEQENNAVNSDIAQTLRNGDLDSFCILNNGVTIVADEISGAGDNITITNYQIVNGCQTSNVLYENRSVEGIEKMHVPIKVIVTNKNDIKSQITRATNNQTAVDAVELEALTEFQRNLEYYYNALPNDDFKLFYERRTNQFKNSDIPMNRIINRETQIKVFSSMLLNKPHLVAGYYGKLIKEMGEDIFNASHDYLPYYTSAMTYFKLEQYYNQNKLDKTSRRFRYQILMIFRFIVSPQSVPSLKDKKRIDAFCNQILAILKNEKLAIEKFKKAINFLRSEQLDLNFNDRKTVERKNTTDIIEFGLKNEYLVNN